MITPETRSKIEEINKRGGYLWRYLDVENKQTQIAVLESTMAEPGFWDNQTTAQKTVMDMNLLKRSVTSMTGFQSQMDDVNALAELVDEEEGENDGEFSEELRTVTDDLFKSLEELEIASFLSGPHDKCNAFLTIHSGAGGTESCDWAEMLYRMYTRWAERNGYAVEVQDMQQGEEAGLSRVTMMISGLNAYGYAKAERGVHRLVRISPFDSNKRRHTSFCSVDVIAEIVEDADVEIKEEDLRIDTYRSSGAGGQHVNKTESAIRLTHLPTGIVVACQNDRSQHKNRATAMRILKSRIYEKNQDEKRAEMDQFYGEKGEIGWGNQIRSYVFQPYQMVKDLRTGVETSDIQGVMDGDINRFVHSWLRAGCPTSRNKDIKMED
ncbi:MAG: peptide chain release factor 2 [Verrucomicrobia bacterium]|nr:peptide chain release factor 2 [Verrucomicrobiota bacterium]